MAIKQVTARALPKWWNEESEGGFSKGWTKGALILDWLERSKVSKEGGKYVFYHATPNTNSLTTLRAGSLLELNPKDAAYFATHDRRLRLKDAVVIKVLVDPQDIYVGHWASLRADYKIPKGAAQPLASYGQR